MSLADRGKAAPGLVDEEYDEIATVVSLAKNLIDVLPLDFASLDAKHIRLSEDHFLDFIRRDVVFEKQFFDKRHFPNNAADFHDRPWAISWITQRLF
jgi:hypothetical protein